MQELDCAQLVRQQDRGTFLIRKKIQAISHLNKLQTLNLSKNKLEKIAQLQQLKELKLLNLSYNNILSVDSLPAFSKLQTLLLNNNKIQSIGQDKFTNFQKLTKLDLSHNLLTECKFIGKITNLQSLNLSFNNIQDLKLDTPLKVLEQLNLQSNQLQRIPPIGEYFPQLIVLNINQNMFCSEHQLITTLADAQMLTDLQFANNPISSTTFESTLYQLFSLDRINKRNYNEPGTKYLQQIHHIEQSFVSQFADLQDDEDDRKIKMSGFYNDQLQNKMTGIKPHRPLSPATKKAKLLIANDFNDIAKNFNEFVQNDKRIKTLRQIYENICVENNIQKPIIQPQPQQAIYLTQGENEHSSFVTRQSITELRLKNDNNQKTFKQSMKEKEQKWAQLKARTKQKNFNIRKSSRAKDVNGSLPKITSETQKGKIESDLMKTQLIPGKFKQRLIQNPVRTGTLFYRPSSQKK